MLVDRAKIRAVHAVHKAALTLEYFAHLGMEHPCTSAGARARPTR